MPDEDWTRSPRVALWTGVGAIAAPILLWMLPWLAGEAVGDLAWIGLWVGLLLVPLSSVAAVAIGWRARLEAPDGRSTRAVAGMALGAVGLALAIFYLVGLWNLTNLQNLENLRNL